MKDYPLTDTQTDIVAEYMASRLLENDKKFSPSLISYQEVLKYEELSSVEEPEPSVAPDVENNNVDSNDDSPIDTAVDIKYTLSEVIGNQSFDIQYTGYKLVDTYPEGETNAVFSIDPRMGYQLLVASFTIENTSKENVGFDLLNAKIQYQLDINVGTVYKPQLTLLENDLQYINIKSIKPGDKIKAVLIFEVTKDIDMSNINLIVSRGNRTEIIKVK